MKDGEDRDAGSAENQSNTERHSHQSSNAARLDRVGAAETSRKLAEAMRLLAEVEREKGHDPGPTVSEIAAAYEKDRRPHIDPRAWVTIGVLISRTVKRLGDLHVSSLTRLVLQDYLKARRAEDKAKTGEPPSPRTVNMELTYLKAMTNWAVDARLIAANPVRRWPRLPVSKLRRPDWGDRELVRLLNTCEVEFMKVQILLRWETGLRPTEAARLRVEQIDDDHGLIRFKDGETKNGKGRTVPFTPRLLKVMRAWLDALPPGEKWVFPKNDGSGEPYHAGYCSELWREIVPASGVDTEGCRVTWHSLRAVYTTCARRRGIDLAERCFVLGHSLTSLDAHDEYEHMSDLDLQRTAVRMELGAIREQGRRPAKASTIEARMLKSLRRHKRAKR